MKNLLVLMLFATLLSCGKTVDKKTVYKTKTTTIEKVQALEGIYYLDNGSQLELVANSMNRISIATANQFLVVENPDGSFGNLASFTLSPTDLTSDLELKFSVNLLFAVGNNVYNSSNVLITGTRRVDFLLKEDDNEITLEYKIYSGAINGAIGAIVQQGILEGSK